MFITDRIGLGKNGASDCQPLYQSMSELGAECAAWLIGGRQLKSRPRIFPGVHDVFGVKRHFNGPHGFHRITMFKP